MQTVNFIVPKADLMGEARLVLGNFIAERATGYYNGNKTSWHVYEVEWIIGEFEAHQNYECDLGTKVIEIHGYENKSVRTSGNKCYVTVRYISETNKREAKKVLQQKHFEKGYTVGWSYNSEHTAVIKHEIAD
ncbi:hypothetical protein [Vibrio agarivorans]|uniref:hypothetical protein n=1 Tax=Vibrio agarivorans TaxID=153622 RepID=UPI0025B2DBB4|nr:hypothetical protein [Vibrio agarivorans]MDN3661147.1 hypothetical protein [Vibrio agarivorans]